MCPTRWCTSINPSPIRWCSVSQSVPRGNHVAQAPRITTIPPHLSQERPRDKKAAQHGVAVKTPVSIRVQKLHSCNLIQSIRSLFRELNPINQFAHYSESSIQSISSLTIQRAQSSQSVRSLFRELNPINQFAHYSESSIQSISSLTIQRAQSNQSVRSLFRELSPINQLPTLGGEATSQRG